MKWAGLVALSNCCALCSAPNFPSITCTQPCATDRSPMGPTAPTTTVFRLITIEPEVNITGSADPPIGTICVAAGKGLPDIKVWGCSCSSKAVIFSWPSGYHGGVVLQANMPCTTLGSRHTISEAFVGDGAGTLHELAVPPGLKRATKRVDRGSFLSEASKPSKRP